MDSNANGYAGVKIDYGGISPQEALLAGAQMKERRKERDDASALQRQRQQQENQWKDFQQVQDIGKDFKPLPQRLQDFSNQKLQDLKNEFSTGEYLNLDPSLLGTVIQQKIQPFIQWHQQAESAANSFEDNFKRWSSVNSNVPASEAYQWGANQFAKDFLTQDKDGNTTFRNPSLIRPRDYVNGDPINPSAPSLSNPDVLGQFDVDMSPLSKNISGLEKVPIGDKQYTSKRGVVHATNWSGIGTNFSNPVEDANGNITGLELTSNMIPGTNIKVATPDFKQAIINSPQTANSYARMRYLTRQHLQANGASADDNTVNYMTDNALHQFASSLIPHDIKTSETTKTPVTRITVNNGNQAQPSYDLFDNAKQAATIDRYGNERPRQRLPLNEAPKALVSVVLDYLNKGYGKITVPGKDEFEKDKQRDWTLQDVYVHFDNDGAHIVRTSDNKDMGVLTKYDINSAVNATKGDDARLGAGDAELPPSQQARPKTSHITGAKNKKSAIDYGL